MSSDSGTSRRGFVRLCASAVALVGAIPSLLARTGNTLHRYPRARLVDAHNHPVIADRLRVGENYLFHYPYVSTPCFLIDVGVPLETGATLHTENGEAYRWPGGVGPNRSIVAFSAICAHRMSHPAPEVSFINYRHKTVAFRNGAEERTERSQVIYCCSEKSVYDPLQGARVLGGPARQPLAAILLEQDATDGTLSAAGTCGGEMFERFFNEFGFRLSLEYRTQDIRALVSESTTVLPLAEFCQNQILC